MQIRILPRTITYVHGTPERWANVDALDLCIAIARHVSLTKSPMVDELTYQAELRELAAGRGFHSKYTVGAGDIIDLATSNDGLDLIVTFLEPRNIVAKASQLDASD